MLTLFPDEKILTQSDNNTVTLTTHRVLYEYKDWGRSYNQNIMLEHITSTENISKQSILLLILAVGSLVISVPAFQNGTPEGLILIGIAVLLFWMYQRSKKNLILVSSPSTKMTINVAGMDRDSILDFINKIEQAKNNRISSGSRVSL